MNLRAIVVFCALLGLHAPSSFAQGRNRISESWPYNDPEFTKKWREATTSLGESETVRASALADAYQVSPAWRLAPNAAGIRARSALDTLSTLTDAEFMEYVRFVRAQPVTYDQLEEAIRCVGLRLLQGELTQPQALTGRARSLFPTVTPIVNPAGSRDVNSLGFQDILSVGVFGGLRYSQGGRREMPANIHGCIAAMLAEELATRGVSDAAIHHSTMEIKTSGGVAAARFLVSGAGP
jgi:hypothetical protein